uniref:Uncharacterized protein n=1 Tax=Leptospirillum ferrodiazotrophum TaxID=412449 RepID=C6HXP6_9BACT|nr:MAG: hypothetical protein UBAL3_93200005 [Leptospirillum ferrodiazotrophum]
MADLFRRVSLLPPVLRVSSKSQICFWGRPLLLFPFSRQSSPHGRRLVLRGPHCLKVRGFLAFGGNGGVSSLSPGGPFALPSPPSFPGGQTMASDKSGGHGVGNIGADGWLSLPTGRSRYARAMVPTAESSRLL